MKILVQARKALLLILVLFAMIGFGSVVTSLTPAEPTHIETLAKTVPTFTSTPIANYRVESSTTVAPTRTPIPAVVRPSPTRIIQTQSRPKVVTNFDMNIRQGPGTNYPIIDAVPSGREFSVTGKNLDGTWWEITYNSHGGWVFGELVTATGTENVGVAMSIPNPPVAAPPPTPTKVIPPTATPKPKLTNSTNCVYDSVPPIPSPGPDIYDCESWAMAYALVTLDVPQVLLSNFNNSKRIEMTYLMYHLLVDVAYKCNASVNEIAALVNVAGKSIEEAGGSMANFLSAPRTFMLGELTTISGSLIQCQAFVAGHLSGLLE